jgi:23S rRNA pseudouridine2605 synthase
MVTMAGGFRCLGTVVSTVSHNSNTRRASACQNPFRTFVTKRDVTWRISPQDACSRMTTLNRPRFLSPTFSTAGTIISPLDDDVGEDKSNDQDNRYAPTTPTPKTATATTPTDNHVRLSKLLSQHTQSLAISRREAERLIKMGDVTVAGQTITSPHFLVNWDDVLPNIQTPGIVKVHGKGVRLTPPKHKHNNENNNNNNNDATNRDDRRIWIVHKLKGEVVAEFDPQGRPAMMERLIRSGVGKLGKNQRSHVKPIGRLDMMTEGLILVTTCGQYAREMELPYHKFHRTYRVRVHGPLTKYKIQTIQRGISIRKASGKDGEGDTVNTGHATRYAPMKVDFDVAKGRKRPGTSTNSWITITCTEGKNRQIRNVLQHLGCKSIQFSLGTRTRAFLIVNLITNHCFAIYFPSLLHNSDRDAFISHFVWGLSAANHSTGHGH